MWDMISRCSERISVIPSTPSPSSTVRNGGELFPFHPQPNLALVHGLDQAPVDQLRVPVRPARPPPPMRSVKAPAARRVAAGDWPRRPRTDRVWEQGRRDQREWP